MPNPDLKRWPYTGHMNKGDDERYPEWRCRGNCDGVCEEKGRKLLVKEIISLRELLMRTYEE